jgi:hypothetical protein
MECKTCGKKTDGSDYCFHHKPKVGLRKCSINTSVTLKSGFTASNKLHSRPKVRTDEDRKNSMAMKVFFMSIWNNRKHLSEVSGDYLGAEAMSTYFHHILPKEKYPEARLDPENIILLSLEEHSNVENDIYKYDEVNRRRETLKTKYGIT